MKYLLVFTVFMVGCGTGYEIEQCSWACKRSDKVMVQYNGEHKVCECSK